jgi:Calcineurin-like phosphoesterase
MQRMLRRPVGTATKAVIRSYSDLHLEHGNAFIVPKAVHGNEVLVLAGDITDGGGWSCITHLLSEWGRVRPVLYVAGNHEYYDRKWGAPMRELEADLRGWLAKNHPNVTFLQNQGTTVYGVHFFGGTGWTDFAGGDPDAMAASSRQLADHSWISVEEGVRVTPRHMVELHSAFSRELVAWLERDDIPPGDDRVVITHHSPLVDPDSGYRDSPLQPAFVATDMAVVMQRYRPSLWIHGHTHECRRTRFEETEVLSNQLGYPREKTCSTGFDEGGMPCAL